MTLLAKPLCAVLMPSGSKRLPSGQAVDFDALYTSLIEPGIVAVGMTPLRADAEAGGGIHAPLHERLLLCDYAVADLTCAGAGGASAARAPRCIAPLRALFDPIESDRRSKALFRTHHPFDPRFTPVG